MDDPSIMWAKCNECFNRTRHAVRSQFNYSTDEHDFVYMSYQFMILQCCGCDQVCFLRQSLFSEDYYPHDEEPPWKQELFPPRAWRNEPSWLDELDDTLATMIRQVHHAMQTEAWFLAALGTRAVLDRVMVEKVGDMQRFEDKVEAFTKAGYATPTMRDPLIKALDAGSATMHQGFIPKPEVLTRIIDIIEVILQTVYLGSAWAAEVESATPPRKKAGKVAEPKAGNTA